jgi:uncharacterized repeat protein (TIGR01451 family)
MSRLLKKAAFFVAICGLVPGLWAQSADLAVTKTDSPDPVAVGSNLTFTITVTNIGPSQATGVTLTDTLPPGVTFVSATPSQGTPCTLDAGVVTCGLGAVDANGSATVTIIVVPTAAGNAVNNAGVTATEADSDLINNSAVTSTTVKDPPTINSQPTGLAVCPGQTAMFSVTASGAAPLSYQWRKGGLDLTGETAATLTINNAQTANAGVYDVRVSNDVGAVISDPATLTVNTPTTATALANVNNACVGSTAIFSTTASGTGPFTYLWRKNGAELSGEIANTLTFTVTGSSAGSYCVEVTGACNSVTNCATLTLATAPTITAQPQNQTTPMANSATFSVTATSGAALTYQWQRNNVNIPGATSSSYTAADVTYAQNGQTYRVLVSNCAGSVMSTAATLTVTPITGISFDFNTPGQFTNVAYNVQINEWLHGVNTSGQFPPQLQEVATGGVANSGALDIFGGGDMQAIQPQVSYDFSFHGRRIIASALVKIATPTSTNNRALQLGFVTATNVYAGTAPGLISAGISDNNPQGFMTVILQSQTPALAYQLRLQHRRTTGSIAEVAAPTGITPAGNVTLTAGNWYQLTATFENTEGATADTFTVAAELQDMGADGATPGAIVQSYPPNVINNPDLVNQKNMFLALRANPAAAGADVLDNIHAYTLDDFVTFVAPPATQTVLQGRQATFYALVEGRGPYSYQWYKNGSPIAGAGSWKYITPPTTLADNGAQYTVEVIGAYGGQTSDPGTLSVQSDPLAVVSVGSADGCIVGVRFNQPVDKTTAENPANYLINGVAPAMAKVYSTHILPDGRNGTSVLLTPGGVLSGAFTVTVQNVQDLSGGTIGVNNSGNGTVEGLLGFDVNPTIVAPAGQNYSFAPGQFEITGAGVDIFSAPDSFRYVYSSKTGDFDIKTRAVYQDIVRAPGKAGFDVRSSLDPNAPHVLADVNPMWPARGLYEGTFRQVWGVAGTSWGAAGTPVRYPNGWLRLRRVGNTFIRYSSIDGVAWQNDGIVSPTPALPDTVYVGFAVCSVANGLPATAIFDSYGPFGGYSGATISITAQPVGSATVVAGNSTNLSVTATVSGAPATELSYVWQRGNGVGGWTNLPTAGSTNNVLNTGALFAPDNGAQYRVIVKVAGAPDVTSTVTTVTVTDSAVPTLTAAAIPASSDFNIVLTFSEPVSATALNTANYTVTNAAGANMGVASAVFLDARNVLLTTANLLVAGNYGVRVSNVQDLNGNTIAANSLRTFSQALTPPQAQPIVVETFGGLANTTSIADLTANVKYTANTPDFIAYSNVFGMNPAAGAFPSTLDNYGARIYSYFVPPTNGAYKFYIRADDFAEFLMNTTGPDRAGAAVQITMTAAANTYLAARAVTNTLVAGQRYYIELRFKETTGADGATLAVRNDNTIPAQGEVAPASLFAFPDAIASPTPVVTELYTGLPTLNSFELNEINAAFGNGGYPDLLMSLALPNVIARTPNFVAYEKTFAVVSNLVNTSYDNYLGIMYSYFIAPSNGLYRFYARSDDSSQLWMNTNAVNSTDPAGKVLLGVITDFYDANYRLMAENVPLIGGQRYYIEGRWRDGTGGDGMTIAIRAQTASSARPASTEIMPASFFEYPARADRFGAVNLAGISPANPVVSPGQTVTFVAEGIGGAPLYGMFWLKNGQPIFGNATTFTTQPLTSSDDGAVFTLVVTNAFSRVERSTTLTVLPDPTAPAVVSAVGSQYQDLVVLTFSEPLDPATACGPAYSINNGLQVLSAALDASGRRVTLRTSAQTPGTTYTVTVNGVRDAAGNTIAANSTANFTAWIVAGSGFYVEIFTNIAGGAVANLTADPKYINNVPDIAFYTNRFGAGLFAADTGLNNYGVRVSGYFSPPTNGLYRFYIRGDDGTQLFMNTNGPAPAGRILIARNDGANSSAFDNGTGGSASPVLSLNADTLYFMEGLMKEGAGGDHMEVALRAVDPSTLTAVGGVPPVDANQAIVGSVFASVGNPDTANLTVSQAPPATINTPANESITLNGSAYAGNFEHSQAARYQWQRSDGSGGYTNIPGAIGPTYTFVAALSDSQIRFIASSPGTNAVYITTLNVSTDNAGPRIISAASFDGANLHISFNEPIQSSRLIDQFSWTVDGSPPTEVRPYPDPLATSSVRAIVVPSAPLAASFSVTANMLDLAGNENNSDTNGVVAPQFTSIDLGSPAYAGSSFSSNERDIDVFAGGSDIWGTTDIGHVTLTPRTGNFDVRVRVDTLTRPDAVTKAGLMVRETLDAGSRTMFAALNPSQIQYGSNPSGLPGRDLGEVGRRIIPVTGTTAAIPGSFSYLPAGVPNAWIRIKRVDNRFTAMRSYDGVNWLTYASVLVGYPTTVYVGLATTGHTLPAPQGSLDPAFAQYRDFSFVPAPIILVQPSPSNQTVPLHSSVTYSVVASNPPPNVGPLVYQWYRNMAPIPGATTATLNIPDATGADNGMYHVEVRNDGGTVASDFVNLIANLSPVAVADSVTATQNAPGSIPAASLVANDSDPESAGLSVIAVSGLAPVTYSSDFDAGVPAGSTVFGVAAADATGGVNGSGALRLNPGAGNQTGAFILNELAPAHRVAGFTAQFKLRISDTSDEPADGFSFNFAPDLTIGTSTAAETGVGTGFSFAVDNYRFHPWPISPEGIPNSSGLKIRYRGIDVAGVRLPSAWNSPRYVPVSITVTPEGLVTVLVDGTNVFGNITLPNYLPTTGRFGFYARTGGQFESHAIDDVNIATVLHVETARASDTLFGSAYSQAGVLHLTDNVNGQSGSYLINETASSGVSSFTATFNLRIGNGTAEPADGFSFNFANDLPSAATGARAAEDGLGNGFSFCVDNYRFGPYPGGGTANTSGMKVRYAGIDVAGVQMPAAWNNNAFVPVSITVAADGALTVLVDGTNVFGAVTLPGWTPASGRFGLFARTGGQNEAHWVDNLVINATTAGGPVSFANDFSGSGAAFGTVVLSGGNVTYTPPYNACGSDTFYYLVSDGQPGGFSVGTASVLIDEANPAPPVIVSCPTNRTVICPGPLADLRAELVAVDNCCCVTVTQDPPAGTVLGYNSATTVTFTVTDSGGRSSTCQAVVTVSASPVAITTQPASQTVFANTMASFSVVASGEAPLTYQWRKNGLDIGGATASSYNIASAQAADAANYSVVVTDGCGGSVTSATATLTVTPCDPIAIVTQPANTTAAEGTAASFSVAVSGTTPYTFQWFENGSPITDATNSAYSRVVTCLDHGNTFHVIVGNPCGQLTSATATLTVVAGPTTLSITREGADVVLSWPVNCTTFIVEQNSTLDSGAWTVAVGVASTVGGQHRFTVTLAPTENRYFRLRQ